jgi:hypothetical protein
MGRYRMGPPEELVLALRRHVKTNDFIETGTYQGNTAAWAARHFESVTTIELSSAFHAKAELRFREHPNVRTLQGNSASVLRRIVPSLGGPAVFWLDAHWSGLDTAGHDSECPLLEEIAVIYASPCEHIILVDDARLFCAPPPRPHRAEQWPDLATTVSALGDGGRRHVLIVDDVFVAVPHRDREFLNNWLQDEVAMTPVEGRFQRWWKRIRG